MNREKIRISIKKTLLIIPAIMVFFVIGIICNFHKLNFPTEASYTHDNNNGFFSVNFLGSEEGIVSSANPLRDNIHIDTLAGTARIEDLLTPAGYFTTVNIQPSSFRNWNELEVTGTYQNADEVLATVYNCSETPVSIAGYDQVQLTANKLNISGIDKNTYPCVRVRLDLARSGSIEPIVTQVKVTWNPQPHLLVSLLGQNTVQAGDSILYQVRYSVSNVNDNGVVIWTILPTTVNGGVTDYTSAYSQTVDPTYVTSSNGGVFTTSETTVRGITIPAGSVYWDIGFVEAGKSSIVSFVLATNNGLENGINYHIQAHIDSQTADDRHSDADPVSAGDQAFQTTISSTPSPSIDKTVTGTVRLAGGEYVYDGGRFDGTATYIINVRNNMASRGRETIFNPEITDDLTEIYDVLTTSCGVDPADIPGRITINNNGVLDDPNRLITWDQSGSHLLPGGSASVSFNVDFNGCPDGLTVNNSATLSGDNVLIVTDSQIVRTGVETTPTGIFAKGERINGQTQINALSDDFPTTLQAFENTTTYLLLARNSSTVRLDDTLMIDKIPDGVTFVQAIIPTGFNGVVFYSVVGGTNLPNVPPAFDYTQAPGGLGADWSTMPPADLSQVEWVAFYIPCISSAFFPSPAGSQCEGVPSQVTAEIQVRINTPADTCSFSDINNVGNFYTYEASINLDNGDADVSALATPLNFVDNRELTHIGPKLGDFSASSSMTGPLLLKPLENGQYTATIRNTGTDSVLNTQIEFNIPQTQVNGILEYIPVVQVSGGTVDYSGLPSVVSVNLGTILPGQTKTVSITLSIPIGIMNAQTYVLSARIYGTDDYACREISAVVSQTTNIESTPNLKIIKDRSEAIISGGEDIHYQAYFYNTGNAPSTNTYVVDRVPYKTIFREAYTTGIDDLGNTYSCNNCRVYFAPFGIGLIPDNNYETPFTPQTINQFFTLGTESSPGVWTSPFGTNTMYVAWKIDDSSLSLPLFPAGGQGKVGMLTTNDENGPEAGDTGSPVGTIIYNYASIFSEELIQAIGNQVTTTILPDPGLRMNKTSSKEVLHAGEVFDWNISYFNDSGNDDTEVNLTDTLPIGVELLGVYHTWNQTALDNGAIPVSEENITNSSNVNILYNADGTTTIEIVIAQGLRGANLGFMEGGNLRINVRAKETLLSTTILQNIIVGCYSNNGIGFCSSDTDNVQIENPDLWIRKLVSQEEPIAGEDIVYTLVISNEGKHDAEGVIIEDHLPAGLCYVSPTTIRPVGWSIGEPTVEGTCGEDQTLTWNDIDHTDYDTGVIPGSSIDIYLEYTVDVEGTVTPGSTLSNLARISNELIENQEYPNESTVEVRTPYPDPYVFKYAPMIIIPGETLEYEILYGNESRESAENVYLIDALPDFDGDGTVDITFQTITGSNGETFYFHEENLNNATPEFNPLDPETNGWTADASSITPTYIAILKGSLGELEGPHSVIITFQTNDPDTGQKLVAGITLENFIEVFTSSEDDDLENNTFQVETRTPGMDLAITKSADNEGTFPGLAPGENITYTIRFESTGTEAACAVWINDLWSNQVEDLSSASTFTALTLYDSNGETINAIDPYGNEIMQSIGITYEKDSEGNIKYYLGSDATVPYTDVCLPPRTYGEFELYGKINMDVADSTVIENRVEIREDSAGIEDTLANNTDSTSTTVYLADLAIEKTGYSCGVDDICGSVDDNATEVNPGETIEYKIEYENAGNIDAENPVIEDKIPERTCYELGTIEANQPSSTVLEYSNDEGITWNYIPIDSGDGTDCNVTDFRLRFTQSLPAPANFVGESGEFNGDFDLTKEDDNRLKLLKASFGDRDYMFLSGDGTGAYGFVYTTIIQSDGKIIIGGNFTIYNGSTRNRIARLNTDGSLDTSFNPGTGANSAVRTIKLQSDGKIIIGGDFTSYNGISRNRIARLNTNGSLDTSFNPGTGANNSVNSTSVQSDGKIIIGGDFTTYNGVSRNRIARLNAGGSLDTLFNPGTGANFVIYSIAIQTNGNIIIGGNFTNYNGTTRNRIARLNTDGTLDITFDPGTGANNNVFTIAIQLDGKITIGGEFTNYNGILKNKIARLNMDGSLDISFNLGTGATGINTITIKTIQIQPDGMIIIGGEFQFYDNMARNFITRLHSDGSLDMLFNPRKGVSDTVYTTTIQSDDKIIIGGSFASYNDISRKGIARLNLDGSLDMTFNPGTGIDWGITKITMQPDGKIIISGSFTSYNGISRNKIARLNADGSLDLNFNPGSGANDSIIETAIQPDGKIIIVGTFTTYNGVSRRRIARLNVDGSLDTTFNPGTGANGPVYTTAIQSDGKIIIGGFFQSYNGISMNNIARINSDGSLDTSFNPGSGPISDPQTIKLQSDEKIIIGGNFTSYNGITRNRIARLNPDGSLDTTFNPGTGANNPVETTAIQSDGKIIIGGSFTSYNGTTRNRIARLNIDGSLDTLFNPGNGANLAVFTTEINSDEDIIVGGGFTSYNNEESAYLLKIDTKYSSFGNYIFNFDIANLITYSKLQVNQDIRLDTDIRYSILDSTCTTPYPDLDHVALHINEIDISSIPATDTSICLRVDMLTNNDQITPEIDAWRISYIANERPSFTFRTRVNPDSITNQNIDNLVFISTLTPETRYDNNNDEYLINVQIADLAIKKDVDLSVVNASILPAPINYAINITNNGPSESNDIVLIDNIPEYAIYNQQNANVIHTTYTDFSLGTFYFTQDNPMGRVELFENFNGFIATIGNYNGNTVSYQNNYPIIAPGGWQSRSTFNLPDVGYYSSPYLVDIDNDGDLDAFVGEMNGRTYAYINNGDNYDPIWNANLSFNLPDIGDYSAPAFVDIDGDNDYDVYIGNNVGNSVFYRNNGSVTLPSFVPYASWNLPDIGARSRPAFADLDNDGDFDAVIGNSNGTSLGYINNGTNTVPSFAPNTAWDVPDIGSYSAPYFIDQNRDGLQDLMIGHSGGSSFAYINTGIISSPWARDTTYDLPNIGSYSAPVLFDNQPTLPFCLSGTYQNNYTPIIPVDKFVNYYGNVTWVEEQTVNSSVILELSDGSGTWVQVLNGGNISDALVSVGLSHNPATLYYRFTLDSGIDPNDQPLPAIDEISIEYFYSDTTINENIPSLAVGEEVTFNYEMIINPYVPIDEIIINSASVSAFTYDPDLTNNSDTASTVIGDYSNVWIEKDGNQFANIGKEVTYTINYGNNGNMDAIDVMLVDTFDPNTTFVSATQTSTLLGITVNCGMIGSNLICIPEGGNLPQGEIGTIEVVVLVDDNTDLLINNTVLRNYIEISTDTEQTSISDDSDDHLSTVIPYALSGIAGKVFIDFDKDVIQDPQKDILLSDIEVILTGYDIYGNVYGPNFDNPSYEFVLGKILDELITEGIVPVGITLEDLKHFDKYKVIPSQITESNGEYEFIGLSPGNYNVEQIQPEELVSTGSNGGYFLYDANGDPIRDPDKSGLGSVQTGFESDVDTIRRTLLAEGDFSYENNFGEIGGVIGDQIFFDMDNNGIYEPDNTPFPDIPIYGIEVTLFRDVNRNGVVDEGIDIVEKITQSNEFGIYYFTGLDLDDGNGDIYYIVVVTDGDNVLDEYLNTRGTFGMDNHSQDASGYLIILNETNDMNFTADFGFFNQEIADELSRTGQNMWWLMIGGISIITSSLIVWFKIIKKKNIKKFPSVQPKSIIL